MSLLKACSFVRFFGRNLLSLETKREKALSFLISLPARAGAIKRGKRPLILIQQRMRLRKRLYEGKGPFLRTI
jgi:hypothetical protein